MEVVRHQTIGNYFNFVFIRIMLHPFKKINIIAAFKEYYGFACTSIIKVMIGVYVIVAFFIHRKYSKIQTSEVRKTSEVFV